MSDQNTPFKPHFLRKKAQRKAEIQLHSTGYQLIGGTTVPSAANGRRSHQPPLPDLIPEQPNALNDSGQKNSVVLWLGQAANHRVSLPDDHLS